MHVYILYVHVQCTYTCTCIHVLCTYTMYMCIYTVLCMMCKECVYNIIQESPESKSTGWKRLAGTPDINFLSQIVLLLFEDESKPIDSSSRYYIQLHIGSGVKARKQTFSEGVPFIDGETHSPSFVKRLPTMITHRSSDTSLPQPFNGVRKVPSYPFLQLHHDTPSEAEGIKSTTNLFGHHLPCDGSPKSSPESPGRKLSIGYTDESLQTLGEPG